VKNAMVASRSRTAMPTFSSLMGMPRMLTSGPFGHPAARFGLACGGG
jgi:hypothetical protein